MGTKRLAWGVTVMMGQDGGTSRLGAIVSAVSCILLLAAAAVSLPTQPPPTAPDPNFVPALRVLKWDRALKLAASNGATLLEITDARKLRRADTDDRRGVLWIYTRNTLRAYGFDGAFRFSVPVPPPEPDSLFQHGMSLEVGGVFPTRYESDW